MSQQLKDVWRPHAEIVAEKCRKMRWRMRRAKCACGRPWGHKGEHRGAMHHTALKVAA